MKYKAMGIAACVMGIVIAASAVFILSDVEMERYHQHMMAEEKAPCTHGDDVFCTHLPLVQIETGGREIPGRAIQNETGDKIIGYTVAEDGSESIIAKIAVTDQYGLNNHVDDEPTMESLMEVHVRGNSSRTFAKPNYAIRLVTEEGDNNPQEMMGMDVHHEWALHGPYLDKTLIRNYMWYNLTGEIMDYAPNVRFCEVTVNGEYQGVYLMTETITAGKEGTRLQLSVDKKDNEFSGYLLRLDRGSNNEAKNLNTFSLYAYRSDGKLNVEYPGADNLTEEIRRSIELDFSVFEKTIYSYDYDSRKYGFPKFVDVENFVDYFLINELACNYDAGIYSTYIYMDLDRKYRLCVWDFNNCCDNYQADVWDGGSIDLDQRLWYNMIIKSDYFTDWCIRRYRSLRNTIFSDEYLESYIDDTIAYLGDAVDRNSQRWSQSFEEELLVPAERNLHSFDEAVDQYKDYLLRRASWLDENIESLKQYSAESKIKKYSEGTE